MRAAPEPSRGTLVLAGVSVRQMAQSARRAGYGVIALDVFGDRDTRDAALQWLPLAAPGSLRIDTAALLQALQQLRRRPGVLGWVAGSGLEALPAVVAQGAASLPLLGTPPEGLAHLRAAPAFFAMLRRLGIPHPATRLDAPADPAGWLLKDLGGSGGWHVRIAPTTARAARGVQPYFQRRAAGVPMSALCLADGAGARVLGHQIQQVAPLGRRPMVWRGVVGPVAVPAAVEAALHAIVQRLVPCFQLRGLFGVDYLLDGQQVLVLEVNARPPASVALYDTPTGAPMHAHVQACTGRVRAGLPATDAALHGVQVVLASRRCRLDTAALEQLAAWPHCHDVPARAGWFARHAPLCTVSCTAPPGTLPLVVQARLAGHEREVLALCRQAARQPQGSTA